MLICCSDARRVPAPCVGLASIRSGRRINPGSEISEGRNGATERTHRCSHPLEPKCRTAKEVAPRPRSLNMCSPRCDSRLIDHLLGGSSGLILAHSSNFPAPPPRPNSALSLSLPPHSLHPPCPSHSLPTPYSQLSSTMSSPHAAYAKYL